MVQWIERKRHRNPMIACTNACAHRHRESREGESIFEYSETENLNGRDKRAGEQTIRNENKRGNKKMR